MTHDYLNFKEITETISFDDIANTGSSEKSKIMSEDEQKKELAIIANLLSKGHVSYKSWNKFTTNEFEQGMVDLYNSVRGEISAETFYQKLDKALQILPDEHLRIVKPDRNMMMREANPVTVGHNLAQRKDVWSYHSPDNGKTCVLALPALGDLSPMKWAEFSKELDHILFNSDGTEKYQSLIIDIRDNPGGAAVPFEILAKKLYGNEIAPFEKSVYRDTPEADYIRMKTGDISRETYENRLQNHTYTGEHIKICDYTDHAKNFPAFVHGGYKKPITVLTNRNTASAGESLCQMLKHHPGVTFVGENTAGCYSEISGGAIKGNFGYGVKIGTAHCSFADNEIFERKGFPVNIDTKGQDAYQYTIEHLSAINAKAHLKIFGYHAQPVESKTIPLANNDFAFIRGINSGVLPIEAIQNLYSDVYPDRKKLFPQITQYAQTGNIITGKKQIDNDRKL